MVGHLSVGSGLSDFLDKDLLAPLLNPNSDQFRFGLATYLDEADFFFRFLRERSVLRPNTDVLEIGSGIGALSLMMSAVAGRVLSLEPSSPGFERVVEYRSQIIKSFVGSSTLPDFRDAEVDSLEEHEGLFDLAICVNVLEHVPKYLDLITHTYGLLKPGGRALFVFPNYSFPYEPHFEIPILFTKSVTRFFFRKIIVSSRLVSNPVDHWEDLSWPTQKKVATHLMSSGIPAVFGNDLIMQYLRRLDDPEFIRRKSWPFSAFKPLLKFLAPLFFRLPPAISPIVECWVRKPEISS